MALWVWVVIVGYGLVVAFGVVLVVCAGRAERDAGYKGSVDRPAAAEIKAWRAQRRRR